MKHLLFLGVLSFLNSMVAQVGINTTLPNATLDIVASDPANPTPFDGLLIPRINTFPTTNPSAAQNGILVFLTTTTGSNVPGFYSWDNASSTWQPLTTSSMNNDWSLGGNSGTDPTLNFLGTTDNTALSFRTNSIQQWRMSTKGQWEALQNRGAIYIGENAGLNDESETFSFDNFASIFIGKNAGASNTTGIANTAIGQQALMNNIEGFGNTAVGERVLMNVISDQNTAMGSGALRNLTTGEQNTAVGVSSLTNTVTGSFNTALGFLSGVLNTGSENVFVGHQAGRFNTTGSRNFYGGYMGGWHNDTGSQNVMIGNDSGLYLQNSNSNVILGSGAFSSTTFRENNNNVVIGRNAGFLADTNNSIFLGNEAGRNVSEDNRLYIHNSSSATPLIYGEFDNAVLRSNATFQIGDPSITGFEFPSVDGTTGQILQTDGNGSIIWIDGSSLSGNDWSLSGNTDIDSSVDFIGTTNDADLVFRRNNIESGRIGSSNVSFGTNTFVSNTSGVGNSALGALALNENTTGAFNVAIGSGAMVNNTTGTSNVAIGSGSFSQNISGSLNTVIGKEAGLRNTGSGNTILGYFASIFTSAGDDNTIIGNQAGRNGDMGNDNVLLGAFAGREVTGSGNVFIGNESGATLTNVSNRLIIDNSDVITPLLEGEFNNNLLRVYGEFQINDPSITSQSALLQNSDTFMHSTDTNLDFGTGGNHVILSSQEGVGETGGIHLDGNSVTIWSPTDGSRALRILDEDSWNDNDGNPFNNNAEIAYIDNAGQYIQASDQNRKQNIVQIKDALEAIEQLHGYTYEYRLNNEERAKGQTPLRTSGVLAQELHRVLPEAVQISEFGEYFVNYSGITPLLIEAIKELRIENQNIKKDYMMLSSRIEQLEKLLEKQTLKN